AQAIGECEELLATTDVDAFGEVGADQGFVELEVPALFGGPLDQAVGLKRVVVVSAFGEIEGDPGGSAESDEFLARRQYLVFGHAVLAREVRDDPFASGGHGRIQLERQEPNV